MTLLAAYDRVCAALAEAREISDVLPVLDQLDHVKLAARRVKDRVALAEATVLQLRAERHLGHLMDRERQAGLLADRGGDRRSIAPEPDGERSKPATLAEIGVDRQLSARAAKAARLDGAAFDALLDDTRTKIRSGRAILVDPIRQAAQQADIAERRAAHAARTRDGCRIEDLGQLALSGWRAGFIGTDPQWDFQTRSPLGEGRSAGIHYKTEAIEKIKQIPVGELAAENCALGMWTVDWCLSDAFELMRHYGFNAVTKLFTWVKTNGQGGVALDVWSNSTWHMGQGYWTRANPEDCWLATRGDPKRLYADVRQLIVAPVMEHSRKPDEWLERSERLVAGPYLELQARRRRPGWKSWGDELTWEDAEA
jgi:N6-adenosine-specific RNA methylase IME4